MLLFVYFPAFLLLLSSTFIPLCLEKILVMISVILTVLRLILSPVTWSILKEVQCAFECNLYSVAVGSVFCICLVRFIGSNVWFKCNVSLLISCLDELSIVENGVLKSPTIIVLLSLIPFKYVSICLIYLDALMLGAYILVIVLSFQWIYSFIIM